MTWRKTTFGALVAFLFSFQIHGIPFALAQEIPPAQGKAFVETMFNDAISSFAGPPLPLPERERRLRALIAKYCDPSLVGRDVTGRYWDKATAEERESFPKLLVDYVVATYKKSLSDVEPRTAFDIQEFEIAGDKALVSGLVTVPGEESSKLGIVIGNGTGQLVAIDLHIDGVSIIKTLREDFTSVLRANGGQMSRLMDIMKAKIALADQG